MSEPAVDHLKELEVNLPLLSAALEQRRLGIALHNVLTALRPFDYQATRFEALVLAADLLRAHITSSEEELAEIIDEADHLGEVMASADSREDLDAITRDFPSFEREIARFHRAVKATLERYKSENLSPLIALGRLLVRMGQTDLGERLQQLDAEVQSAANGAVTDLPQRIEALQTKCAALQAELTVLAKDPEVNAFLLALSRGSTSLRLVTPAVLRWLEEQHALDQFRVFSA